MGVLLAILLAQSPVPDIDGPILSNPATMSQLAFFEFAPASGAGMGTACACSAVTGAKGEAMTFTRASSATCTKGTPTTGIANGDLVTCATDQPRVGAPTGGSLMLLVEGSRTNSVLRSQELDNAYWSLQNTGCGATTRTANAATAPDGTMTADHIDVPACTAGAGRYSVIYTTSAFAMSAAPWAVSFYAKGVSGSGTVYASLTPDGVTYLSGTVACSFVSTSWTRCTGSVTATLTNYYLVIGSDHRDPSQTTDNPAASVYIWGVQAEAGAYTTSYIPTTSAAVTRSAESASFAVSFANAPLSMAATVSFAGTRSSYVSAISLYTSSSSYVLVGQNGAGLAGVESYAGTGASSVVASALATGDRVYGFVTAASTVGGLTGGKNGSNAISGNSPASATHTTLNIGTWDGASLPPNGYVGAVCADPSPTRCR